MGDGVLDVLLEALARVKTKFECVILGDGNHKPFCEDLSRRLGLADRVHFKGFIPQEELKGYYRECSVVALSSVWPEPIATIGLDEQGRLADPILRTQLALFEVRARAFTAMSERFIDELKAGRAHPAQPSMMKYYGTELNKSRHELVMASGGSDAAAFMSAATLPVSIVAMRPKLARVTGSSLAGNSKSPRRARPRARS